MYAPWQVSLQRLIDQHGKQAANKRKEVSNKTRQERASLLFLAFRQLHEMGFRHLQPTGLKPRHIQALMARWEQEDLSASTLQARLSILTTFATWIGKPGLIQPIATYLADPTRGQRQYVAKTDKSWSAAGVDLEAKIAEVEAADRHVGLQLRLQKAFGLRRKEAVMFKPFRADKGVYIELTANSGTKGGRPRTVPIDTDEKRDVLARAKDLARTPNGHVANPSLTLKQALDRYSNVIRQFGITEAQLGVVGHGLRHQYANDRFEAVTGQASPVRGGPALDRNTQAHVRLKVSEELGHSREGITSAYYGPIQKPARR